MDGRELLGEYLKNVNVEFLHGRFCRCPEGWRRLDDVPSYSKFYYIVDGEGWLKIDGIEYDPRPGEMYLMPAGVRSSYSAVSDNRFTKYFCHFTAAVGGTNLFDLVRMPPFVRVKNPDAVTGPFTRLFAAAAEDRPSSDLRVKAALLELLAAYMDEAAEEQVNIVNAPSSAVLREVTAYIQRHLTDRLTVEDLADRVHLHPASLTRLFDRHMLISPKRYINAQRLLRAKELLVRSDRSIADIAALTGYSDAFYFSKSFKNQMGVTPSEYRNALRHKPKP